MLIHLCPRFLLDRLHVPTDTRSAKSAVRLELLLIPELHVELRHGEHLATRRPYPNKRYYVGCRRIGQKAENGILIDAGQPIERFTATMRWIWACKGAEVESVQVVRYRVLDTTYDWVSDESLLWHARSDVVRGEIVEAFESRVPPQLRLGTSGLTINPRMDSLYRPGGATSVFAVRQRVLDDGRVIWRDQDMELPTLERGRLRDSHPLRSRVPPLHYAIMAPHVLDRPGQPSREVQS